MTIKYGISVRVPLYTDCHCHYGLGSRRFFTAQLSLHCLAGSTVYVDIEASSCNTRYQLFQSFK